MPNGPRESLPTDRIRSPSTGNTPEVEGAGGGQHQARFQDEGSRGEVRLGEIISS
jgi:hypothetical protein